jgi:RHS repeat-associated protein
VLSVTDNYIYKAFGLAQLSSGSTVNSFRYIGQQGYYLDTDIAQYLLRARVFDPASGRFRSQDPIEFTGNDLNLYRYATNNPIAFTDPTGTQCAGKGKKPASCCCCVLGGALDKNKLRRLGSEKSKGFGHRVVFKFDFAYVRSPKETPCTLIWKEFTNDQPPIHKKKGLKDNQWNDIFDAFPFAGTFKDYLKNLRGRPCPGKNSVEFLDDALSLYGLKQRVLLWAVTLKSARDCDCPKGTKASVTVYASQLLFGKKWPPAVWKFFDDIADAQKKKAQQDP